MVRIRSDLNADFFHQGFNDETDPFKLSDLAERLTNLLSSLDHGTVSILDGRWGTGKTVFARQWHWHLQENSIPAIYFDAFSADYMSDPFQAVCSAFLKAASDAKVTDDPAYSRFLDAAAKVGKRLGITVVKIGTKAATLGIVGSAEIEELSGISDDLGDSASDLAEEAIRKILKESAESEATFEGLRKSLLELPDLMSGGSETGSSLKPLVVIIDELDRCRPDFALGILETLKHFFRSKRIHFILVTNKTHLLSSIDKKYGSGVHSNEYLEKFYDFVINFEKPYEKYVGSPGAVYARRLTQDLLPEHIAGSERRDLESSIVEISQAYDLTLRQVEMFVINALMGYLSVRDGEFRPSEMIAFLAVIKLLRSDLYKKARFGDLTYSELAEWIDSGNWSENFHLEHFRLIMQYHTDMHIDEYSDQFRGFSGGLGRYNFRSRLSIIPYLCNSILERFGKA